MAYQKTISQTNCYGVVELITHGILANANNFVILFREIKSISDHKAQEFYKINWKKNKVFDNSNRGKSGIYGEDWN